MTTDEVYCAASKFRSYLEGQVPKRYPDRTCEVGNLYQIRRGDIRIDVTHSREPKGRSPVVGTYFDLGSEDGGLVSISLCAYLKTRRKQVETQDSLWVVEMGTCLNNFDAGVARISRLGYIYPIAQPPTEEQLSQILDNQYIGYLSVGAFDGYNNSNDMSIPGCPDYSGRDLLPVRPTVVYGRRKTDPLEKFLRLFRIAN